MDKLYSRWGKTFLIIIFCSLLFNIGMGLQTAVNANFVVDVLGLNDQQYGLVAGIREMPGLITVILAIPAAYLAGNVYTAVTVLITAVGLFLYSQSTTFGFYMVATIISPVVSISFPPHNNLW